MRHVSMNAILGTVALGALVGGCATTMEVGPGYYHYDTGVARPNAPPVVYQEPAVVYRATRLTFRADAIEPLADSDAFRVVTPEGNYQMTKAEFYEVFANVVSSDSYRYRRIYNYSVTPAKAAHFLITTDEDEPAAGA